MPCRIASCPYDAVKDSATPYCNRHRRRNREHGHPEQEPIPIKEIREWEQTVRALYQRLPKKEHQQLKSVAAKYCEPFSEWLKSERTYGANRFRRNAAERLYKVFEARVDSLTILTRLSAMYVMYKRRGRRFIDDRAFRYQLVRAYRKLASVADGIGWSHTEQRTRYYTKAIPARTRDLMGDWLADFIAEYYLHLESCLTPLAAMQQTSGMLASEIFDGLRDKLNAEHAKQERKLQIARRLLAESKTAAPSNT